MAKWGALIKAPIGFFMFYIALLMFGVLRDPVFGSLSNTTLHPHGGSAILLLNLIVLLLAIMLLYSIYRDFTEPDEPQYQYAVAR